MGIRATDQLKNIVASLPPTPEISPLPAWERQSAARAKMKDVLAENEGPNGQKQEATAGSNTIEYDLQGREIVFNVDARVRKLIKETEYSSDEVAEVALAKWDKLGSDAVEKFGASPESTNQQAEGLEAANQAISKHEKVQAKHDTLTSSLIEHMDLADADVSNEHALADLIKVDWEPFADQAGISHSDVNVGVLKRDPAFQEYRNALVSRVQELAGKTKIDIKNDIKSPGKLIKNIWHNFTVGAKIGFTGDARADFNIDLNNARVLSAQQIELQGIPSITDAQAYLSQRGEFLRQADWVIDNELVRDAMPIIGKELKEKQGAKLKSMSDTANIEAYTQIEKDKAGAQLRTDRLERVRLGRAEQARQIQEQAEALAKERAARMELNDLDIQATNLARVAGEHRAMGMKALMALGEANYVERNMEAFNAQIADGKLPVELEELIHSDVGAEVDQFIKSNGRKGDVEAVHTLFKNLGILVNKADRTEGLPTSFLPLNALENVDNNGVKTQLETGISVGLSEDGSWEIRPGTRQNGKIEIKSTDSVIRLEPENIRVTLNNVADQEGSLADAKDHVRQYESAMKLPGGSKGVREQTKRKLTSAQKSVTAYTESLAKAKAELAAQLKTTAADKTLGGAFAEMTKAQSAVAEAFYNQDFVDMVDGLSKEFNIPASDVTAEALAALAAEAEHSQIIASDMAEYFEKVKVPGALQKEIVEGHRTDIEFMAERFVRLQEDEASLESIKNPEAKTAADKQLKKQRKALEKEAELFGEILNNDFVEAVPEVLRKGSKAASMTKTEFKKSVDSKLRGTGFDPKFEHEIDKNLKKIFGRDVSSIAEGVRQGFTYDSEIKAMSDAATDALRVLGTTEAAQVLQEAIAEGDVDGFLKEANAILESSTTEQFDTRRTEADRTKLAELLSTPEGIAQAMETGVLTVEGAVDAIMNGSANAKDVMTALEGKLEVTRDEAAEKMSREIAKLDKKFDPDTEPDPLADRPDIASMAQFIQKQKLGQNFAGQWRGIALRAMEKKTAIANE